MLLVDSKRLIRCSGSTEAVKPDNNFSGQQFFLIKILLNSFLYDIATDLEINTSENKNKRKNLNCKRNKDMTRN